MMKVRRYLRGSGRVLAFVFVASVIWLLFDMAALRLSINDVNSQILKERVIRERVLFKQQAMAARLTQGGFKHPLQRVDVALSPAGKEVRSGVKLAEVYRQREKKEEQKTGDKERESTEPRGHNLTRTSRPKPPLPEHKEGSNLQMITPEKDNTMKDQVERFDVNGIKRENSLEADASEKQKLPLVPVGTVQGSKEPSLTLSEKESPESENVGKNALDESAAKATERVTDGPKNGTKDGHLEPLETHPAQTSSGPPNKDIDTNRANMKTEEKHVGTAANRDLMPSKDTSKPAEPGSKATQTREAGVHKVLHLDATLVPRDAKAVGQFGQAVLLSSSEDAQVRKRWDEGFFNVYLSDQIPVDRSIPDTRPET